MFVKNVQTYHMNKHFCLFISLFCKRKWMVSDQGRHQDPVMAYHYDRAARNTNPGNILILQNVCVLSPFPKEACVLPHAEEEKFHLPFPQDIDIFILEYLRACSEYHQLQLIYQQYRHCMSLWKTFAVELETAHLAMCLAHKHQGLSLIPRQVARWDGQCL